jgi:hypothetical protein
MRNQAELFDLVPHERSIQCPEQAILKLCLLSALVRTFFAIPAPFSFWKEVKTNPFNPDGENLAKRSHDHFRYLIGHG